MFRHIKQNFDTQCIRQAPTIFTYIIPIAYCPPPPTPIVFNGFLTNYIASLTNICTAYSPNAGVFLVSLLKKISEVAVEVVFVNSTLHLFRGVK